MNTKIIVFAAACLGTLAVLAATAGARTYEGDRPAPARGPDVAGVNSSRIHDFDRNRVYDNLDATLSTAGEGDRITAIVLFTHKVGPSDVAALQSRHGSFRVNARWNVVPGISAELTKGQIRALAHRPDVAQIEPERVFRTTMSTAKRWYGVNKATTDFGLNGDRNGNSKSFSPSDVNVCVVDTGIDAAHADLNEGQVIGWKDFVNGRTAPYDDNGHGTHVAGIAAGQGDANSGNRGNASGASLVGVKVLAGDGSGTTTAVINGIDFCVQSKATHGVRIMNLSLGSSGSSDGTDATSVAVNNAFDAGILPVVAAGNDGPSAYTIGSPAAAAKALTVCSLADPGKRGFFVSDFSSRGPTADGRIKPDVCGAGHRITAPKANSGTGYVAYSGTSMATPFVAGVAALMLDANYALTPADLKSKLIATAQDWRVAGADVDTGYGRVQAYEAIKSAGGYSGSPQPVPNHFMASQTLGATGSQDRFTFDVTTTAYPVALTLIIPGASYSRDFDVYLYDPSGYLVGRAETVLRQATIAVTASTTGRYTAIVYSYAGSGGYDLDFSHGGNAPALTTNQ